VGCSNWIVATHWPVALDADPLLHQQQHQQEQEQQQQQLSHCYKEYLFAGYRGTAALVPTRGVEAALITASTACQREVNQQLAASGGWSARQQVVSV
jgi:hypothetical protein